MAYADWKIKLKRLVSCSCAYGCPCEFSAPPTHGFCQGVEGAEIVEGYFEDIRLDGLRSAGIYHWPGPVHEGNGHYQPVIDAAATRQQTKALFTIFSGREQEPTTIYNIYNSTIEHDYDPIFAEIEFDWDLKAGTGRIFVKDVLETSLEPIRNPVTGKPHRATISLHDGFEFRDADMVSSTFWAKGAIKPQQHEGVYGYVNYVTYGPYGLIVEESYPKGSI